MWPTRDGCPGRPHRPRSPRSRGSTDRRRRAPPSSAETPADMAVVTSAPVNSSRDTPSCPQEPGDISPQDQADFRREISPPATGRSGLVFSARSCHGASRRRNDQLEISGDQVAARPAASRPVCRNCVVRNRLGMNRSHLTTQCVRRRSVFQEATGFVSGAALCNERPGARCNRDA